MTPPSFRKEEEKSYAVYFAVISLLLLLVLGWTLWEETYALRPWKSYQKQYNRLLRAKGLKPAGNVEIKQNYLPLLGKTDRCVSCHAGIDKQETLSSENPLASHPGLTIYLGKHPVSDFGCTMCHSGQGLATTSMAKAHGNVDFWHEPMLDLEHSQANCQRCHAGVKGLRGGRVLEHGKSLFERKGCYGCHETRGFEKYSRIAPPLTQIGKKVNYSWIIRWLQNPRETQENSRMPDYAFNRDDAAAIADFIFGFSQKEAFDKKGAQSDENLAEKGRIIYAESRCSICHSANGLGGAFKETHAPDLSYAGSKLRKEWILDWIKDPKMYHPLTKMPRFRFSDQDRQALAAYITSEFVNDEWEADKMKASRPILAKSRERGAKLVEQYGCFGCHEIQGFEKAIRIAPELTGFGAKPLERFDFGKTKIPHGRASWVRQKLKEPRIFSSELRMPNFHLDDDEITALTTFVIGQRVEDIPEKYRAKSDNKGWKPQGSFSRILNDVKCLTCHGINGEGGSYAPDLSYAGSKLKKEWLAAFLQKPDIIRPLLQQMPKFNLKNDFRMIQGNLEPGEIETIVNYFRTVLISDEVPLDPWNGRGWNYSARKGKEIFLKSGCNSCHQTGDSGGAVGPSLTKVGKRLTPGYIYVHLKNPRRFVPNNMEPDYGLSDEDALSLTSYLVNLQ